MAMNKGSVSWRLCPSVSMIFSESNTFFTVIVQRVCHSWILWACWGCCFDLNESIVRFSTFYCCRILPMGQQPETSATVLIQHNKDISLNEGPKMVKIQAIFSAVSKSQAAIFMNTVFAATTTQIGICKRCWWFGRWIWKHLQEASQPEWRCSWGPTGLSFLYSVPHCHSSIRYFIHGCI